MFVGIPLAAENLEEISAVVARLRSREDGLRWTVPESWHITLQFLGTVRAEQYECLVALLGKVRCAPIPIQLAGMGFFDRAGIVYAGVGITPGLIALQRSVTAATVQCGFAPEMRPYHPHITLARAKGRRRPTGKFQARMLPQPRFTRFVTEEFLLYESHLSPDGSTYEVRQRFPLDGPYGSISPADGGDSQMVVS
jgi:2'-5' RNA ligase